VAAADGRLPALTGRQSLGCFAVAALGLAGAALCIGLGVRCLATTETFDCIGLLTVFPAAFLAVGLTALAIGWRRFVNDTAATPARRAQVGLGAIWQPLGRPRQDSIIPLLGRSAAENEEQTGADGGG
jgi:hypothetical protein